MQTAELKTTQLGQTNLEITRVGFGAWAIGGGGWEFGWGPQQDEQSIAAIQRALELGVNWIETAAAYGLGRPFAERDGTGVIVYSPMGSGLLTGAMTPRRIAALPDDDWRKHDERFREPQLSRNLDLVEGLGVVADRHDTVSGAVAIAWTLRNPAVDGAIVGFRSPELLIDAANLELSEEDNTTIEGEQ